MKTKILIDKKQVIYNELSSLFIEILSKNKAFKNCSINGTKLMDLACDFNKLLKSRNKLDELNSKINRNDSKYKNPNITTQVYQIALFNTYSSI